MPLYEYQCEACGKITENLRKMADADAPATCESCGSDKTRRIQSVFAASGGGSQPGMSLPMGGGGGGCGCGNPHGPCNR